MARLEQQVHVLSVQSHVVSGYVGNTAASFPMQLLGIDVHMINSVQFSNHTGYPVVKGRVLDGPDLESLVDGLVANDIARFDYILTGYIGSESFLNSILKLLDASVSINPKLRYICDPVLGDNGKLYVPLSLINVYKEKILPRAYMITPNQMEAETLSSIKIKNEQDVCSCLIKLHSMGPQVIAITSVEISDFPGKLCCYIASKNGPDDAALTVARVIVNKLSDHHYTGTGDVTCALLLSWIHRLEAMETNRSEYLHGKALLNAISTIQAIICRAQQNANCASSLARPNCRNVELPIIQSKTDIENPPIAKLLEMNRCGDLSDLYNEWSLAL